MQVAVLLSVFALYLTTLTPTVGLHDSGELITSCYILGVCHPPGYPLYTILGKLWITAIPIGNIAFRMNAQSALSASISVLLVYNITRHLTKSAVCSAISSLLFAFSPIFWEQAIVAEKYTLNALFLGLLLFLLIKGYHKPFFFLLGLSFCHHFQTLFLLPGAILFLIKRPRIRTKRLKYAISDFGSLFARLTKLLLLFVLPLSLWLYIPIRASTNPPLNWNSPKTLERFTEHITAADYQPILEPLTSSIKKRLIPHLSLFSTQFSPYLTPFGIIGLFALIKRLRLFLLFLLTIAANIFWAVRYNIPNIADYYIPSFFIFSVTFGYCIQRALPKRFTPILFAIPLFFLLARYPASSRSDFYIAYNYGRDILEKTEDRAVIFADEMESLFSSWYIKHIEMRGEDKVLLATPFLCEQYYVEEMKERYPDCDLTAKIPIDQVDQRDQQRLQYTVKIFRIKQMMENNPADRPIYIRYDKDLSERYTLIPDGVFFRIEKEMDEDSLLSELKSVRFFPDERIREIKKRMERASDYERTELSQMLKAYTTQLQVLGAHYTNLKAKKEAEAVFYRILKIDPSDGFANYFFAEVCLSEGRLDEAERYAENAERENLAKNNFLFRLGLSFYERGDIDRAIHWYEEGLKLSPRNLEAHGQLGLFYYKSRLKDKAVFHFKKVLEIDPQNLQARRNLKIIYGE